MSPTCPPSWVDSILVPVNAKPAAVFAQRHRLDLGGHGEVARVAELHRS